MDSIEVDGARLAFEDTGSPKPGAPTLLLVHGFPLSHAMWRAQIDGLKSVCRVVAPDLRGYGASSLGDWPTDGATPSLDRYADDLAALIEHLDTDGPVVFAGFSMGGYTAFAMLQRHADRFDALALIDTRAGDDTDEARATRLKMADKVSEWGAARVAELMRPKLFAPDTDEQIVQQTVELIASADPAAIAASQRAMAARPDSTPMLAEIDKPTLVVAGEHDALTPAAEMRGIAEAIPNARYVEIEGAGHMAPVEKPEAVNAALREFVESP
ncbi:MAG: alpha/beta fold hydrolase [Planctomycetota bacterium]